MCARDFHVARQRLFCTATRRMTSKAHDQAQRNQRNQRTIDCPDGLLLGYPQELLILSSLWIECSLSPLDWMLIIPRGSD